MAQNGLRLVDLFEKSIVRPQAALIAKNCSDAVGGHDESLRISMDLDLAFRIFMRYPIAYLDDVFFHRKHDGNIGSNQELRPLENIKVIEKLVENFPQAETFLGRGRVVRRLAYRFYRMAKGQWKSGNKEAEEKPCGTPSRCALSM